MDTTFPGNELMYRSITNPLLWQVGYALIIAAEGVTGLLFLAGAVRLWQARNAPGADFNRAKAYAIAGALFAFLVWFFGFMVIAGEWFAMWESKTWNGQEAAFRFYMAVLAVLILLNQPIPICGKRARTAEEKKSPLMTDRQAIEDLLEELYAARVRGDLEPVTKLFAADATFQVAGSDQASPMPPSSRAMPAS